MKLNIIRLRRGILICLSSVGLVVAASFFEENGTLFKKRVELTAEQNNALINLASKSKSLTEAWDSIEKVEKKIRAREGGGIPYRNFVGFGSILFFVGLLVIASGISRNDKNPAAGDTPDDRKISY